MRLVLKIAIFFEVEAGRKFTPEYFFVCEDLNFRPNEEPVLSLSKEA
jgi:hypothetical protein